MTLALLLLVALLAACGFALGQPPAPPLVVVNRQLARARARRRRP